jgi:hypothetical protein
MEAREHIGAERIKLGDVEAGHRLEDGGKAVQAFVAQDHTQPSCSGGVIHHNHTSIPDLVFITNVN